MMHGGRLIAARQAFPNASAPFIDLSTGINPHCYPIPPLPNACLTRLPEPEDEQALREAAAACYGVSSAELVVAAPGTQALIQLLPLVFPAERVGVLSPTYSEHAAAWRQAAVAVETPEALGSFQVGVLCNPNNPDGRVLPAGLLMSLAEKLANKGGYLLVDEAFADFAPEVSLARYLPHRGLVLLRSFGKAFGLAGVRLGFMLADQSWVKAMQIALGPWAVSGPAIFIGCQALQDKPWQSLQATSRAADAAMLDTILAEAGLTPLGGTALFRLARSSDAGRIARILAEAGILVRSFPAQPAWLRFGLPGPSSEWARLQSALINCGRESDVLRQGSTELAG